MALHISAETGIPRRHAFHSHRVPLAGRLDPVLQLLLDESKDQVHHAPNKLHESRRHLPRGMSGRHSPEVGVQLHVVRKGRLGIGKMQERIDESFFSENLVDDLRDGRLV
jgi:hypothetical protein